MFLQIFDLHEANKFVNTNDFGGLEAQNHDIHSVCLPLVAKNAVFTVFFCPGPSKNSGIYAVFSVLQDVVSIYGKHKNTVFYDVFRVSPGQIRSPCHMTYSQSDEEMRQL